jgi:hypothetical protein
MFDMLRIGYLDDDELVAELNKHQSQDRMCHCYVCRECRVILAARGLTDDNDLDRNNSKNPSPQADLHSGDI